MEIVEGAEIKSSSGVKDSLLQNEVYKNKPFSYFKAGRKSELGEEHLPLDENLLNSSPGRRESLQAAR